MRLNLYFILGIMLVTLLAVSMESEAEESIGVMVMSKHFNAPECKQYGTIDTPCKANEINAGLSYTTDIKGNMYGSFGAYYNSFSRLSTHIGMGYRLKYAGIAVSAITGYPMSPVMPSVVPYLELPINDNSAIQFLMPFMPGTQQVLALQYKYILK